MFSEADVPTHPPAVVMTYIPIEIVGVGALIASISFMGYGFASEPSANAESNAPKADRETGVARAA